MDFEILKKKTLDKLYLPDKSKKGDVDKALIPLINLINKHSDYYTLSSCAGRIVVFTDNNEKIKSKTQWLLVSHEQVDSKYLIDSLSDLPESMTSFKAEGMILHVACRDYKCAVKFMVFCQNNGYKHTGIIGATNKRTVVQVLGVERFDAPIAKNKELLVSQEYLEFVLNEANKKLKKTHSSINRLYVAFEKEF